MTEGRWMPQRSVLPFEGLPGSAAIGAGVVAALGAAESLRSKSTAAFYDALNPRHWGLPPEVVAYGHGWGSEGRGEYLVDVAWCYEDPPMKTFSADEFVRYRGLVLVAECEWDGSGTGILTDLVKLVDLRAYRRLFFGSLDETRERPGEILEYARAVVSNSCHGSLPEGIFVALWGKHSDEYLGSWMLTPSELLPLKIGP